MNRKLKTLKGSVIKRSTKYGVGKEIGGKLYVHKQYEAIIPHIQAIKTFIKKHSHNFSENEYNIVCFEKVNKKYTFIAAKDFDTSDEPKVGSYRTAHMNGHHVIMGYSSAIYHHKWLFVKDDYEGFDVQGSFERSKKWLKLPDVSHSRIGNKVYWATITSQLEE